jgi:hypothetical protein
VENENEDDVKETNYKDTMHGFNKKKNEVKGEAEPKAKTADSPYKKQKENDKKAE